MIDQEILKNNLRAQRLSINEYYENDLIKRFCSTDNTDRNKRVLSNWMEGYIYCLTLGIKKNQRRGFKLRDDKSDKKNDKASWIASSYLNQYVFLASLVLSKPDILTELGILPGNKVSTEEYRNHLKNKFLENDFNREDFFKSITDQLKDICDEYVNYALHYLEQKKEEGVNFSDDYQILVSFLHDEN